MFLFKINIAFLVFFIQSLFVLKTCCLHIKYAAYMTLVKSAERKFNFLISQPKHMLWVLNDTVLLAKHMLKLMGKKIFTILR